jgi:hypothetical protein
VRRAGLALVLVLLAACSDDGDRGPEVHSLVEVQELLAGAGYDCVLTDHACELEGAAAGVPVSDADWQETIDYYESCGGEDGGLEATSVVVGNGWLLSGASRRVTHDIAQRTGAVAHTYCDGAWGEDAGEWVYEHLFLGILIAFWIGLMVGAGLLLRRQRREVRAARHG